MEKGMLYELHILLRSNREHGKGEFRCRYLKCVPRICKKYRDVTKLNTHMATCHGWVQLYPKLTTHRPPMKEWKVHYLKWLKDMQLDSADIEQPAPKKIVRFVDEMPSKKLNGMQHDSADIGQPKPRKRRTVKAVNMMPSKRLKGKLHDNVDEMPSNPSDDMPAEPAKASDIKSFIDSISFKSIKAFNELQANLETLKGMLSHMQGEAVPLDIGTVKPSGQARAAFMASPPLRSIHNQLFGDKMGYGHFGQKGYGGYGISAQRGYGLAGQKGDGRARQRGYCFGYDGEFDFPVDSCAGSPSGHAGSPSSHAGSPSGHAGPSSHAGSPDGRAGSSDGHAGSPGSHAVSPGSPDGHAGSPGHFVAHVDAVNMVPLVDDTVPPVNAVEIENASVDASVAVDHAEALYFLLAKERKLIIGQVSIEFSVNFADMMQDDCSCMSTKCFDSLMKLELSLRSKPEKIVYILDPLMFQIEPKKFCRIWDKRVKSLDNLNMLCVPIVYRNHWSLLVLMCEDMQLLHLDSSRPSQAALVALQKHVNLYFKAHKESQGLTTVTWKRPPVPKQPSGSNLDGWFTLYFFFLVLYGVRNARDATQQIIEASVDESPENFKKRTVANLYSALMRAEEKGYW